MVLRRRSGSAYNNTTAVKTMQFVQQQLAQVGIKAEARALEAGQRIQVYGNKDPKKAPNRLYIIGWSNSTVDPDWGMRRRFIRRTSRRS